MASASTGATDPLTGGVVAQPSKGQPCAECGIIKKRKQMLVSEQHERMKICVDCMASQRTAAGLPVDGGEAASPVRQLRNARVSVPGGHKGCGRAGPEEHRKKEAEGAPGRRQVSQGHQGWQALGGLQPGKPAHESSGGHSWHGTCRIAPWTIHCPRHRGRGGRHSRGP